jgi:hypothetical protein
VSRYRYSIDCPRCDQREYEPGTVTRTGWDDGYDGDYDSPWGACDTCGFAAWTPVEVMTMNYAARATDLDREAYEHHRDNHPDAPRYV